MTYTHLYLSPNDTAGVFDDVMQHCYPGQTVSPSGTHDFLRQRLVLLNNGVACARVSIYFNPYIENGTWLLGQYACISDPQAAAQLLGEAENYIRQQGGKKIIGPMNGSTWDVYRFSVSGGSVFFTEQVHAPWYTQQFRQNGFTVNARYFSGKDSEMIFNRPEVLQRKKELEATGIHFREMAMRCYEQELRKMYPFVLAAFSKNHLYSPIGEEEFVQKYLAIRQYIDPRFVIIAENESNETVGLFFCLPDHFNTKEKGLVIKTIARKNTPELRGLGHVMCEILYAQAQAHGVQYTIHAFMHQEGTSVEVSKKYSGISIKQYELYEKTIV